MINRPIEYQRMADCEEKHWWYRTLHNNITRAVHNSFGDRKTLRIVDAGCGTGGMMDVLKSNGYSDLHGFDLSSDAIEFCRQKNLNAFLGDVRLIGQYFEPESVDVIICNDILCYFPTLEEQQAVMDSFRAVLKDNGIIILNLPAFDSFSGMHDLAVGIQRRSSIEDMKSLKGDLRIRTLYCWPFMLFPLILLTRKLQKRKLKANPDAEIVSDVSAPAGWLNRLFYFITNTERRTGLPFRFASSVFAVFQKSPH